MSPAIQKQQFRNESGGWIGVVLIGPKGDEQGHAVEPGQTVWLSEPEQILTANAPRRPEDNPFVAKTVSRTDPITGEHEEYQVTPLVPESEDRFVPANHRPIPADLYPTGYQQAGAQAQGNIGTNEPTVVSVSGDPVAEREAQVKANPELRPNEPPPAPPRAAAAADAAEPPAAPEEPPTPEEPPVPEEIASEETGAAQTPASAAVTGSFRDGEEVATPEAPQTAIGASAGSPDTDTETPPVAQQARPWTPQDDPAKVSPPDED